MLQIILRPQLTNVVNKLEVCPWQAFQAGALQSEAPFRCSPQG